ncbi:MAG: helix-turn-helix domain-containing protein [Citromicrobium sp.]|nr:helix-turn-helix domain-containing protein [Citromicrobium sp.]MAO96956.1 helix-turn-helix domain-containing protein [Citromicrobium sp.]MAS85388.1 helix-turn-helix domain-containing protein [Erythrobacteraceae bacterium]MBD75817.1 helix-turn-helix domain-containing protein [Citromicrobium sp.]MBT48363.1 helix-turn-helix domain-containing protein [Citromicrobium sp.]
MADDEAGFEIDNSEPTAPGERLRAAREAKGLSIDDVCAATRIPKRHLETIEDGDFAVLPGRTYAIGFSRSYAKAVGLNDEEIVNEVREQLGIEDPAERLRDGTMQTEDPTRLPSRGLVFGSIIAAVVLLAGLFAFSRTFFDAGAEPASLLAEQDQRDLAQEQAAAVATESASAQPAASGPVVFTSTEDGMWVRFYDGDESNVIMEKLMSKGETYTIPDTARDPKVRTGRPDAFAITVGGKSVPPLAKEDQVMSDVEVSAEALLARDGTSAADAEGATE